MLTEAELAEFERWGAVTVETTFTAAELDAAEAGWDALAARIQAADGGASTRIGYREMGVPRWPELAYDASTIDVIQHPWFEAVTKQALRTERAHFFQQAGTVVLPSPAAEHAPPEEQWRAGAHCDTQLTTSDWEATPRRTVLCFWLWLSDATPDRAAMRYVPGSHLRTASHWERVASDADRRRLPRIYGTDIQERPGRGEERTTLPVDGPVGGWLREQEPVPLLAKRGQATVMTTALLHSAWANADGSPRKSIHTAWSAAGVPVGLPQGQDDAGREIYPVLRQRLRPERRHIIPEVYPHFTAEGPLEGTVGEARL